MDQNYNQYGQAIGEALVNWSARSLPGDVTLQGAFCHLEPLDVARHASDLYEAYRSATDGRDWTYMFVGPFKDEGEYRQYAEKAARSTDPKHYAVIDNVLGKAAAAQTEAGVYRSAVPAHAIRLRCVAVSPL